MFTGRGIPTLGKHRKAWELNSLINSGSVRCWRGVGGVQKKSQVKPDQLWRKQGWQHTEWGRGHFLSLIRLYNNTQIMRGQQSRENKRTIHSTTKKMLYTSGFNGDAGLGRFSRTDTVSVCSVVRSLYCTELPKRSMMRTEFGRNGWNVPIRRQSVPWFSYYWCHFNGVWLVDLIIMPIRLLDVIK